MAALRLTPVVLSVLLLAAHFLRAENMLIVVALVLVIGLLWIKRPWSARVVQIVLVLGALEWLLTLSELVSRRMELGLPYARLVAIIGTVALLTGLSAVLFQTKVLRERYGLIRTAEESDVT